MYYWKHLSDVWYLFDARFTAGLKNKVLPITIVQIMLTTYL